MKPGKSIRDSIVFDVVDYVRHFTIKIVSPSVMSHVDEFVGGYEFPVWHPDVALIVELRRAVEGHY